MKYIILLCDGMSDYPVMQLDYKTPMEKANKPYMDRLAQKSEVGLVKTIDDKMSPGSDVANLSVMGYDPCVCYTGRSPLEAVSMGIELKDTDVALRCNLVTLSDEADYKEKTMLDYCAGDIHTDEAKILIEAVNNALKDEEFSFFSGVSYRHCTVWQNGKLNLSLTPPHDISNKKITDYLPLEKKLYALMEKSYDILKDHPINIERIKQNKRPANSIWLWGEGTKPKLDNFYDKYKLKGAVISAVDLLKGIGKCAGMYTPNVKGATGYIDTDFNAKVIEAINCLENGYDLCYMHIEAPDECGHRGEIENKVKAIELIDSKVLKPLMDYLDKYDDYKILILPDHATPLVKQTHTRDAVPYMIYTKSKPVKGVKNFNEKSAAETKEYIDKGCELMNIFIK